MSESISPTRPRALRVYETLLRLYPREFRREYGGEMARVFSEQQRDAAGRFAHAKFWGRLLADLARSVPHEHLQEIKQNTSMDSILQRYARVSFGGWFFISTLFLLAVCVTLTMIQPRVYMSVSRVDVGSKTATNAAFGPYEMQTAFEKMTSERVLNAVSEELGLAKRFEQLYGKAVNRQEVTALLRSMIQLRQSRNTYLVEVQVFTADKELSAVIANRLVAAFQTEYPSYAAEIVDTAQAGLRPVRPNIPMNIVIGGFLSALAAVIIAAILRLSFRQVRARQAA